MLWLKNYDDKINKNILLTSAEKLAFLKHVIDKEGQSIVSQVERNFKLYTEVECINMIHNHRIRQNICAKYDTDDKTRPYFAANGSVAYKKK